MATQIKRDEHIRLADGRSATLSAVQLSDKKFETMLLLNDGSGEEIVSYQSTSKEDAVYFFNEIKDKYHVPELTGKYKKLADDLKAALAYGLEHMGTDDGGTSNFDVPSLTLPGWKKKLVEAVARTAGVVCFEWKLWNSKTYAFSVHGTGQGDTRTNAAEAMSRYLEEQGNDMADSSAKFQTSKPLPWSRGRSGFALPPIKDRKGEVLS